MHSKNADFAAEKITEWNQLAISIRSGEHPDAAHLIFRYLDLGSEIASISDKDAQRWIYHRMLEQLENTICDSLIAKHWRENCANNLYRPLYMLAQMAESAKEKQESRKLSREAYRQCKYFLSN